MLESFPNPEELRGAVHGTMLYLALYLFVFVPYQSFSKFHLVAEKKRQAKKEGSKERLALKDVKYYNSKDVVALVGDRTVGNFLEFAIVFLPLMWIHALFVDPTNSFMICAVYVAFRALYPILFQHGFLLLLSTVPGYMVIGYLLHAIAYA